MTAGVIKGRGLCFHASTRNRTELPHHSQIIIIAPVLRDLLLSDAKEMHSGRRDMLSRGGDTKKLPGVSEVIGASDYHQVPFGDLVLDSVMKVRKCRMIQRYNLLMPLTT